MATKFKRSKCGVVECLHAKIKSVKRTFVSSLVDHKLKGTVPKCGEQYAGVKKT